MSMSICLVMWIQSKHCLGKFILISQHAIYYHKKTSFEILIDEILIMRKIFSTELRIGQKKFGVPVGRCMYIKIRSRIVIMLWCIIYCISVYIPATALRSMGDLKCFNNLCVCMFARPSVYPSVRRLVRNSSCRPLGVYF